MGATFSSLAQNNWVAVPAIIVVLTLSAKYLLRNNNNNNHGPGRRRRQLRRGRARSLTPAADASAWRRAFAPPGTSLEAVLKRAVRELPNHRAVCPIFFVEVDPPPTAAGGNEDTGISTTTSKNNKNNNNNTDTNTDSLDSSVASGGGGGAAAAPAADTEAAGAAAGGVAVDEASGGGMSTSAAPSGGTTAFPTTADEFGISSESTLAQYLLGTNEFLQLVRSGSPSPAASSSSSSSSSAPSAGGSGAEEGNQPDDDDGVAVFPIRMAASSDDGAFLLNLLQRQRQREQQQQQQQQPASGPAAAPRPAFEAPLILLWAGEDMAVLPCTRRLAGEIMSQLEVTRAKCAAAATRLGQDTYRAVMAQRLRALADMRAEHTLRLLVQRGVISAGDVIVDDPRNPAHNAQAFHGDWLETGAAGGDAGGAGSAAFGNAGSSDMDAVEEVQRFLLKEEQERALQESLAADRAKAARRAEEEKLQREAAERAEAEAEAQEAKDLWARMHREHLRESFEESDADTKDDAAATAAAAGKMLRLSVVYPTTSSRKKCSLPATATLQRLAEYAYAYAPDEEDIGPQDLDDHRISFHISFPKPQRFELSNAETRDSTLEGLGLRSGTLLRLLVEHDDDGGGGGGGDNDDDE